MTEAQFIRLGVLTPSSNTVVEPVMNRMVAGLPEVSVHFSRFRVMEISAGERSSDQFEQGPILEAASLLADAQCDPIIWCGTSGSWLGFDRDDGLCTAIQDYTGAAATTSILALNEILSQWKIERLAIVTPYTAAIQVKIIENYRNLGLECVAESHLNETDNFSFCETSPERLLGLMSETLPAKPQAIATVCTNLRSTFLVAEFESRYEVLVLDSIAAVLWKALRMKGRSVRELGRYGRLFLES